MHSGKRIGIVVPRCGEQVLGGAEALALKIARDLSLVHKVEVLTTCAHDYRTWENYYTPGVSEIDGIQLRRFPVDAPRDVHEFDRLSRAFRYRIASLTVEEQERWLRAQGPYSSELFRFLSEPSHNDIYLFMSYLYAPTYFGLPLVRDRSILMPLAHDEWPMYFPVWENIFGGVRSLVFASPEEREMVQRRFHALSITGDVMYPSILRGAKQSPSGIGEAASSHVRASEEATMLYLGRIDESKSIGELCEFFHEYVLTHSETRWKLQLAGPYTQTPQCLNDRIEFLGAVDEATKHELLHRADLFVMPSRLESLCIALLEAWSAGLPSLVNAWNPVLVGQSRRSNGGLWYHDARSFAAALDTLTRQVRKTLGQQGHRFAIQTYTNGNTVQTIERATKRLAVVR